MFYCPGNIFVLYSYKPGKEINYQGIQVIREQTMWGKTELGHLPVMAIATSEDTVDEAIRSRYGPMCSGVPTLGASRGQLP